MTQKWRLTAHALRRITERFGVEKSSAANWTNQHMADAEYVCNTLAEDGTYGRMFAKSGIVFIADLIDSAVLTVLKAEIPAPAVSAVAAAVGREVKRKELAVLKAEVEALAKRAPLEQEAATLRLAIAKARTAARRNALTARMNAVELQIREINAGITKEKRELTLLAQGYAAIV
ncbi:hypothetical protein DFP94_101490 [Fontibacillus phaseoli]|uniref:Uncharacterized protein n=2 Tax=Fontibacillus phaseoli TaxID=1416533 RepID=A0A369BND0_9BACL|nr:hypothetical protein DFP94_101490 [Fontibacillus phaseoli]